MSLPSWRQVIVFIVVIFCLYAVFTDPSGSAGTTSSAWGHVKDGIDSVSAFFDTLLKS